MNAGRWKYFLVEKVTFLAAGVQRFEVFEIIDIPHTEKFHNFCNINKIQR